jgi:hypothetical protein
MPRRYPLAAEFAPGTLLNAQRKFSGVETGSEPAKSPFVPFE